MNCQGVSIQICMTLCPSAIAAEQAKATAQLKQACDDARRSQVESLNQILRRLRESGEEKAFSSSLIERLRSLRGAGGGAGV